MALARRALGRGLHPARERRDRSAPSEGGIVGRRETGSALSRVWENVSSAFAVRSGGNRSRRAAVVLGLAFASLAGGCTTGNRAFPDALASRLDASFDGGGTASADSGRPLDGGPIDAPLMLDPDAACASSTAEATFERLPVDIVWVLDNSASMAPAIEQVRMGLNAFASQIAASGLDYRVILLSLRGTSAPSGRYAICVPPPLAGPGCANAPTFFHISLDVRSTQPLEQFLGTLGQTEQYRSGQAYGPAAGEPTWHDLIRPGATRTIVVVTDDNARMVTTSFRSPGPMGDRSPSASPTATADFFERFAGGLNPFNGTGASATRALPPGILDASWAGRFNGYTFAAIYGWGSETDPTIPCTFSGGVPATSSGPVYTELVRRTSGVRARICDGPAAWGPFFDAVASAVVRRAGIECDVALPPPPEGTVLDPSRVNVQVRGASGTALIRYSGGAGTCSATDGGWYYDDGSSPTRVILCPASCDFARAETATTSGGLDVVFGCSSIPI